MNITKLSTERIRDLLNDSISHMIHDGSDTTDDVDLLLNELLALRELAEAMAKAIEKETFTGAQDAVEEYRAEYPEED
jgi:hypothetical protein